MATKFCPNCGAEYLATVEECLDCEISLVDELPTVVADGDAASETAEGHVEYELADWAGESRGLLEQLLTGDAIPHVWEAGNLVVPALFETRTDALIDQVEVTTLPTLDPDAPKVAYEIEDWSDEQQTDLMSGLERAGVPYEFDEEGSLVVLEDHEDQVEVILDSIEFPDALPEDDVWDIDLEEDDDTDGVAGGGGTEKSRAQPVTKSDDEEEEIVLVDEDDANDDEYVQDEDGEEDEYEDDEDNDVGSDEGLDAAEVMSDLFVSADRLMHNARDAEGVLSMVERSAEASSLALPYGFNRAVWNDIVAQAAGLNDLLEDDDSDDEQISESARVLRDTLRQFV